MLGFVFAAPSSGQDSSPKVDVYQVRTIIDRAEFDFSNTKMYKDQKRWIGKTIGFRGSIYSKPVILAEERNYIQVRGSGESGDPVDVVIFLDNPLPSPKGYPDQIQTVGPGQELYFFGTLQKCRDFVSNVGAVMYLPTVDGLMIYERNDRAFSRPLWTSQALQRR